MSDFKAVKYKFYLSVSVDLVSGKAPDGLEEFVKTAKDKLPEWIASGCAIQYTE